MIRNPAFYTYLGPPDAPGICLVTLRFNRDLSCQAVMMTSFTDRAHGDLSLAVTAIREGTLDYLGERGPRPEQSAVDWIEHQPASMRGEDRFWLLKWDAAGLLRERLDRVEVERLIWQIPTQRACGKIVTFPRGLTLVA